MIVTVTLNPSLDRTVEVAELARGRVLRARGTHLHPGGKGVNVTRALLANGVPSRAVVPVGGPDGDQLVELLAAEAVDAVVVPVSGRTRSNITIAEPDGTVTKLNEPGAALTAAELDLVLDHALADAVDGGWVVLCGSLPPGAPVDTYARLTRRLSEAGRRVAVDTSGAALGHAVAAGPALVKPNAEELAGAVGRPLASRVDVVAAAQELRAAGARAVLVSLGAAGAVLVDDAGVLVGECDPVEPRSTVGAGDAFLAGFLGALHAADGAPGAALARAALAQALAWGAAAVRLPGSQMPGPGDIDLSAVRVLTGEELDACMTAPLVGTG
ncbi:MAG: 1-phosphofructokinase [Actinomycetales bacterium]|nr:1-phosphofructokinase [Actinomycetales bacterium]